MAKVELRVGGAHSGVADPVHHLTTRHERRAGLHVPSRPWFARGGSVAFLVRFRTSNASGGSSDTAPEARHHKTCRAAYRGGLACEAFSRGLAALGGRRPKRLPFSWSHPPCDGARFGPHPRIPRRLALSAKQHPSPAWLITIDISGVAPRRGTALSRRLPAAEPADGRQLVPRERRLNRV